jgi:hypothetical protein
VHTVAPPPAEISRIVAEIGRRFPGVLAWWGRFTGEWWALARDGFGRERLVGAPDPAELGRRLEAVLATPRFIHGHPVGAASRPATGIPGPGRPAAALGPRPHSRHVLPRRGLLGGWR